MIKKILITAFISCIIVIAGIVTFIYFNESKPEFNISTEIPLADETNATAESVSLLVDSLNDFSFNFYKQISEREEGNIFFSPYSIFTAFSMAYEGARGNTATEMQNVLNIQQNDPASLGSFGKIYNLLNQDQDGYIICTANAFWAHQDYEFLLDYLSLLQNFYMAEANELDFANNVEAAEIINNWIEDQTNNKIQDMIEASMLSDFTKLILTNAIYFKGEWAIPFDPDNTFETDFELTIDYTVKVNMMENVDNGFNYTETEYLQILELPYVGDDLSMIIILPKENDISIAESRINSENLSTWRRNFIGGDIIVQIPKFKFEKKYGLNDIMREIGIVDAFEPDIADFSGMDGTKWLFISEALHQSYIEVNEEGTEAAAATGLVMEATYIPEYKEFIADHPFLFLIQHKETEAILFMGKVMNPATK